MLREEYGQITVFLSLLFCVFLGLSLCVLEGMRSYTQSALVEDAFQGAGKYILANYNRTLFQNYHVFFLDPKQRNHITSDGKEYLNQYTKSNNVFDFSCQNLKMTQEKTAVDAEGLYLKHQIREWMKYREVIRAGKTLKELLQSFSDVERGNDAVNRDMNRAGEEISKEEIQENIEEKEAEEETVENKENQTQEGIQWKELKDMLVQLTQSGILLYVVDDVNTLSSSSIKADHLPSQKRFSGKGQQSFLNTSLSFLNVQEWKEFLKTISIENRSGDILLEQYFLLHYAEDCFRYYGKEQEGESVLKYEIEYLIAGTMEDRENLKRVAERIFAMRFLVNYMYLSQNGEWKATSNALAGTLTGVLGFPQAQKAVQVLLTAALCFGESLLDVHALFSGQEIPIIKTEKTWNLSLENGVTILKEKGPVKKGKRNVSYEDYLKILLAVSLSENKFLFRMMDIMQENTALKESGFLLEESLFSFRWEGEFYCEGWFSCFPGTGILRKSGFDMTLDRLNSY